MKKIIYILLMAVTILPWSLNAQNWVQFGNTMAGTFESGGFGNVVDMNADGTRVVVGSPFNDEIAEDAGKVEAFEYNASNQMWEQIGQDLFGNNDANKDRLGQAVQISNSGDYIAIGASQRSSSPSTNGYIKVYGYNNMVDTWFQIGQTLVGDLDDGALGDQIDMTANGLTLISAQAEGSPPGGGFLGGRVQVWFYFSGTNSWVQKGQNIDGPNDFDLYGDGVAISPLGNRIAFGANDGDGANETVRIYDYNENNDMWELIFSIVNPDSESDTQFGTALEFSGDGSELIIGNYGAKNGDDNIEGAVYVYQQNGANWTQLGNTVTGDVNDEANLDWAGSDVAISSDGTRIGVGARRAGEDLKGIIKVYDFNSNNNMWEQVGADFIGNKDFSQMDEVDLTSDGSKVVTGDMFSNEAGTSLGAVKVYELGAAPSITSIARQTPSSSPTNANSVTFRVTFSEDVQNVGTADFSLSGTAAGNWTISSASSVSGDAAIYDVVVNENTTSDGTLNLDVASGNDIQNLGGTPLGNSPTIDSEEEYVIDNIALSINSISRLVPSNETTNQPNVLFSVNFSEVIDFVSATFLNNFSLSGTAAGNWSIISASSIGSNSYAILVSRNSLGDGTLNLDIVNGNTLQDLAGNALGDNPTIGTEQEYIIDNTNPTVENFTPADNASGVGQNDNLVIDFNENISVGSGNIVIKKSSDNSEFESIPVGDSKVTISNDMVTINPAGTFEVNTAYYVEIETNCFEDGAGNKYAGISDNSTWNFNTNLQEITIATVNATVDEVNTQTLTYRFTRTETSGDLTVNFSIAGTATSSDYTVSGQESYTAGTGQGTIKFLDGNATVDLVVTPTTDAIVEANETVIVTIEAAGND